MGCGWQSDMKSALNMSRESKLLASALNLEFQKSRTFCLVVSLNEEMEGGWERIDCGSGREYFRHISFTLRNQELLGSAWSVGVARTCIPSLWRMCVGPSLDIIPSRESCLRWRMADAGNEPARK